MVFGPYGAPAMLIAIFYSFAYGVVSRLPMIYAMVHLVYTLQLDGILPALVFAGYCLGRLLGAVFTSLFFGMPTMLLGTFCGVIAHVGILLDSESVGVFAAMVVVAGFTETVTGIDMFLKIEAFVKCLGAGDEQLLFRWHFVTTTAGSIVAYLGGGWLYDKTGVVGIAWAGLAVSSLGCLVLLAYARLRPALCLRAVAGLECLEALMEAEAEEAEDPKARAEIESRKTAVYSVYSTRSSIARSSIGVSSTGTDGSMRGSAYSSAPRSSIDSRASGSGGRVRASMSSIAEHVMDPIGLDQVIQTIKTQRTMKASMKPGLDRHVSTHSLKFEDMGPEEARKMKLKGWSVVVSYFVTAMPIGQNFALMALFWRKVWSKGTAVSGLLMSTGEVLGLVVLLPLASKRIFSSPLTRPFRKPMNLVVSTLVSAACVALVPVPQIVVSGLGGVAVHVVNVLLHTFCNEIGASWFPIDVYAMWVGRCYLSKRLSNATMAFLCISLFTSAGPRVPYMAIGSVVFVWSFVLLVMYYCLELLPFQQAPAPPDEEAEEAEEAKGGEGAEGAAQAEGLEVVMSEASTHSADVGTMSANWEVLSEQWSI